MFSKYGKVQENRINKIKWARVQTTMLQFTPPNRWSQVIVAVESCSKARSLWIRSLEVPCTFNQLHLWLMCLYDNTNYTATTIHEEVENVSLISGHNVNCVITALWSVDPFNYNQPMDIYGSDQRSTMMKRLALTFCNTPLGILFRIATDAIQNETINPDRSIESRSSLITRQQQQQQQQLGRRHCGKGSDEEINVQIASQSTTLQYTAHISFERSIPKRFIHPPPTNDRRSTVRSVVRPGTTDRRSIDGRAALFPTFYYWT